MPEIARADLISARKLPDLVDKAVEMALQRIKVSPAKGSVITKWELMGRRVKTLPDAEVFSQEVAKSMAALGTPVEPALLKIDKWIIAGFFERPNVPFERGI
jgi:hypothetical protein